MQLRYIKKLLLAGTLAQPIPLSALPLYTAREGRQCDNCHAYPFETDKQMAWQDPPLAERKCNLSCQTCHLDPGGGGLRNVPGRYHARATLPMLNTETRPWHDRDRNIGDLLAFLREAKAQAPTETKSVKTETPAQPATQKLRRFKTHDLPPFNSWYDPLAFGHAWDIAQKKLHPLGPEFGVYGKQNADPLLQFGLDSRFAFLSSGTMTTFFPMQTDLGARFHPVEHWTAAATFGLVGRANPQAQRNRPLSAMYTIRNAFVMLHELPYQAFVRAGMFQPTFGMRQEDHTAPVRRHFEMDLSQKYSAVIGMEVGLAPNYPYLSLSAFTNNVGRRAGDPVEDFTINMHGFGAAVAAGWRDLAFGGGISFMHKRRNIEWGGNLTAFSIDGYFNPGRFWLKFPLTFTGELAIGEYSTLATRQFYANYFGVDYLLANGINLKLNNHAYDPDVTVRGNESGRIGFGVELIPLTWFKILVEYRLLWALDPRQAAGSGAVNPFDWLADKQWVVISHIYF
ncbi:MAG: hypothetical protein NZL89_05195 [Leptospiraceae bacterium]|nr:hypothetical protein [Leptospiraceae bacterium]